MRFLADSLSAEASHTPSERRNAAANVAVLPCWRVRCPPSDGRLTISTADVVRTPWVAQRGTHGREAPAAGAEARGAPRQLALPASASLHLHTAVRSAHALPSSLLSPRSLYFSPLLCSPLSFAIPRSFVASPLWMLPARGASSVPLSASVLRCMRRSTAPCRLRPDHLAPWPDNPSQVPQAREFQFAGLHKQAPLPSASTTKPSASDAAAAPAEAGPETAAALAAWLAPETVARLSAWKPARPFSIRHRSPPCAFHLPPATCCVPSSQFRHPRPCGAAPRG